MVTVGERINEEPIPLVIPPHETEYHFQIALVPKLPPVKPKLVADPEQINDGVADAEIAG